MVIPTMIGAAALLADGMITPAVEGLTKIEGLENISVIPIVIGIISTVFFLQRFGSQKMGNAFGPLMTIWFVLLFILGMNQILDNPFVLKALNPYYAYELLSNYPNGFWLLGAVFLCTTGAEALYSDLGHCGRKNIRLTWGFVKVSLMVNYLGQAAWLLSQDEVYLMGKNPFFELMPNWFLLPGIIVATVAAVIASQALITGSYTLINEAINLNFWPRVAVKQPSEMKGQIYIPSVNVILWLGCITMILYFQTSSHMEAAYGMAITLAMLMTTYLLSFFLRYKLRWNKALVFFLLFVFIVIEVSFFVANVVKFQEGGYMTVVIGGILFLVMYISFYGRQINMRYTKTVDLSSFSDKMVELSNDSEIPKLATHLVYLTKVDRKNGVELRAVQSIFDRKPKRADVYWFFHINRTNEPYTHNYEVFELVDDKVIKIVMNIGFRIQPRTELYLQQIIEDLIANKELNMHLRNNVSSKYNAAIDFKFILLEKYLSVDNEFRLKEGTILKLYFFLKRFAQKAEKAFGLDRSDVSIEQTPLLYQPVNINRLVRKTYD